MLCCYSSKKTVWVGGGDAVNQQVKVDWRQSGMFLGGSWQTPFCCNTTKAVHFFPELFFFHGAPAHFSQDLPLWNAGSTECICFPSPPRRKRFAPPSFVPVTAKTQISGFQDPKPLRHSAEETLLFLFCSALVAAFETTVRDFNFFLLFIYLFWGELGGLRCEESSGYLSKASRKLTVM